MDNPPTTPTITPTDQTAQQPSPPPVHAAPDPTNIPQQDPSPPPQPPAPSVTVTRKPIGVLLAVCCLVLIAASAVFAYVYISQQQSTSKTMAPRATPTMVPEPTPAALFLNIDTKLGSVDGEMLVSGRTLPDSAVVIYTDSDETNVQSDSTGSFEGTLLVSPEDQYIHAAVFAADGQEKTTTLELVQEEEVLGESTQERATTEEDSMDSESAPEISRTLQEPENRAPDKRRGEPYRNTDRERYQGESEDVPSLTAEQDRKETKEMREERIREFIRVSTPSASTVKEIKRGIIEIRKILTQDASKEARIAQAIKVLRITAREASSPAQLKRHAVSGVIVSLSEGSITIAHAIQRDRRFTVYYNADTKITAGDATEGSLPVLAEGLRVAVVGETEGDVLLAKRIHVIPGKATGIGKRITPATGSGSMYSTPSATVTSGTTSSP